MNRRELQLRHEDTWTDGIAARCLTISNMRSRSAIPYQLSAAPVFGPVAPTRWPRASGRVQAKPYPREIRLIFLDSAPAQGRNPPGRGLHRRGASFGTA